MNPDLRHADFLRELCAARQLYSLPPNARLDAQRFVDGLLGLLFPHFTSTPGENEAALEHRWEDLHTGLARLVRPFLGERKSEAKRIADRLFDQIPEIYRRLRKDAQALFEGDPAAENVDEVILTYPGFLAIAVYRVAHPLYRENVPVLPRLLTEYAHQKTGIDIHPGARIGERFFIDHGTGVVVGETTVIGDNVKLYQGVTLGATSVDKALAGAKRHPTLEANVVVYASATILGGDTVVGHDSVIGGNVFLTASVPSHSTVTRRNEVRVKSPNDDPPLEYVI